MGSWKYWQTRDVDNKLIRKTFLTNMHVETKRKNNFVKKSST